MQITAILAVRNDAPYLANCIRHLVRNGIDFLVIDNESKDASAEIYGRSEFASNLVAVEQLPFSGAFALSEQLRRKTEIIQALNSDWIIHLDADEIMHSFRPGETLNEAIYRLDVGGWNAIDFDEFVFLPIEADYVPDIDGPQPLLHYYYFRPSSPRLMRAWKKNANLSMTESGGHVLFGSGLRLAPEPFALRHCIFRSQQHAFTKYETRQFAADELARAWHHNRVNQPQHAFKFPAAALLRKLSAPDHVQLNKDDPWDCHYWQHFRAADSHSGDDPR